MRSSDDSLPICDRQNVLCDTDISLGSGSGSTAAGVASQCHDASALRQIIHSYVFMKSFSTKKN